MIYFIIAIYGGIIGGAIIAFIFGLRLLAHQKEMIA
jgi:hypothetical protein